MKKIAAGCVLIFSAALSYAEGFDPLPERFDPNHPLLSQEFQATINELTGTEVVSATNLELLIDYRRTIEKRIELAQEAKQFILMQSMILSDFLSEPMAYFINLIKQRASEIEVYLVVDDFSSLIDLPLVHELEAAGVKVIRANSLFGQDPYPWYVRMHEKYFIIDGKKAVLGGQNISDVFWPNAPFESMRWRDTDIYVEGPIVNALVARFEKVWHWTSPLIPSETDQLAPSTRFLVNEIYQGPKQINAYLLKLIEGAEHEIVWMGNHVYLTDPFFKALVTVANRGVRVIIGTNSHATSWYMPGYYQYHYVRGYIPFFGTPIELRLYQGRYNHSKIFYVDGVVVGIGSLNHDRYSLENDSEEMVFSYDPDFNRAVRDLINNDLDSSLHHNGDDNILWNFLKQF